MAYLIEPAICMLIDLVKDKCKVLGGENIRQALSWFHESIIGPVFAVEGTL